MASPTNSRTKRDTPIIVINLVGSFPASYLVYVIVLLAKSKPNAYFADEF